MFAALFKNRASFRQGSIFYSPLDIRGVAALKSSSTAIAKSLKTKLVLGPFSPYFFNIGLSTI